MKLDSGISAIVTGGASGLGAATARGLAAAGVRVGILDRNEAQGAIVAREIGGLYAACDVTDQCSIDAALGAARTVHGQERILVNCAGIATGQRVARRDRDTGAVISHDLDGFARVVQVNLLGTFNMIVRSTAGMMALPPVTADGGRGVIVSTSSVAAEDGQIGQAAYAASKGGVLAMTLPIARELARDGIRVCAILPGLFDTPMFATIPPEARKALEVSVPFPSRLGNPAEYAALVLHICENDMLNAAAIRLDGGVRLAAK